MIDETTKPDTGSSYIEWVADAEAEQGEAGLQLAIGGEFEAFGIIQREMLKHYGLKNDAFLIDVGCGAGRLALQLRDNFDGRYLGLDIVPLLLSHAREKVSRDDWRFEQAEGFQTADVICFFSVLTHLRHEQSYLYLEEARRVLKPNGIIVFSFLEFAMDFHWDVFKSTIENERSYGRHPLNTFIERQAIVAWAKHLDLTVVDLKDGDEPFVPLPHPVILDSGAAMQTLGHLGQSVCVLARDRS